MMTAAQPAESVAVDGRGYTEDDFQALLLEERRVARHLLDDELVHFGRMARLCLQNDEPPEWFAVWMRARVRAAELEWRWRKAEHKPDRDRSYSEWIEEAKRRIDLAEVIALHYPSRPSGRGQWQVKCPLHDDSSPSLSVDPKAGLWYCFGCMVGGDVLRWWSLVDGLDWRACLDRLESFSGLSRPAQPTVKSIGLAVIRA